MRFAYFITHPNVQISADVPVVRWPLSDRGRERMKAGLRQPWVPSITSVFSSTETKATDGAEILGRHLGIVPQADYRLGENDRSSTGFLPPAEFEVVADEFFAKPDQTVRGWERAVDAQDRIVSAVRALVAQDRTTGSIAFVSHGAVGTLLYCHLAGKAIDRKWDQPPNGGGNYFRFSIAPDRAEVESWWRAFDAPAAETLK